MQGFWMTTVGAELDDPLMMELALQYYSGVSRRSPRRAGLVEHWFTEACLRHWLETEDYLILKQLLATLPAQCFAGLTECIAEQWHHWPNEMLEAATPVLAKLAPELTGRIVLQYLDEHQDCDDIKLIVILSSLDQFPSVAACRILQQLLPRITDTKHGLTTLPSAALAFALRAMPQVLPGLIDTLFLSPIHGGPNALALFGEAWFDNARYVAHCQHLRASMKKGQGDDCEEDGDKDGESHGDIPDDSDWHPADFAFTRFAAYFEADAPLAEMDATLASSTPFPLALELLQAHRHRSKTIEGVLQAIQGCNSYHRLGCRESLSILALAALAHTYERRELDLAGLDLVQIVDLLGIDPHPKHHIDQFVERLRGFPGLEVAQESVRQIKALKGRPVPYQLLDVLGELGGLGQHEAVDFLISTMVSESASIRLPTEAMDMLATIGSPVCEALVARWDTLDAHQKNVGMAIIGQVGGPVAAEFARTRASELFDLDSSLACKLAAIFPDMCFLEKLSLCLDDRESEGNRSFYWICRCFDLRHDKFDTVRAVLLAAYGRRSKNYAEEQLCKDELSAGRMLLALRCSACGALDAYRVHGVAYDRASMQKEPMLVVGEMPCKACGALAEFAFTPDARSKVIGRVQGGNIFNGQFERQAHEFFVFETWVARDGSAISYPHAYFALKEKLRVNANDLHAAIDLSFVLQKIKRPLAALACLQKAREADVRSFVVLSHLANLLRRLGRQAEAFELLSACMAVRETWRIGMQDQAEAAEQVIGLYGRLREELGRHDLPAQDPSVPMPPPKVGRNDLCPCGSGKKYKKCCLH